VSSAGALQVAASSGDLRLNGDVASHGGRLELRADSGALTMAVGTVAKSSGGAIHLQASGTVALSQVDAGPTGSIAVQAGADITAVGTARQLTAGHAALTAGGSITGLHTELASLSLQSGGSVSLSEASALSLAGATADGSLTLQTGGDLRVTAAVQVGAALDLEAGGRLLTSAALSGTTLTLTSVDALHVSARMDAGGSMSLTAGGAISLDGVVQAVGALRLNSGATLDLHAAVTAGSALLQSVAALQQDGALTVTGLARLASGGDLVLNGAFSAGGAVSLLAGGDLWLNGTSSSAASIDGEAAGSINFGTTAALSAAGALRLLAGQDLNLGSLQSGIAVSLIAGRDINSATAERLDISAPTLRLSAGHAIGSTNQRLQTQVGTLSGRAGSGGIWVLESDELTVGDVAVSVHRLDANGGLSTLTDVLQSDLITTQNGSIGLRTVNGSIIFSDGSAPADQRSIRADGTGTVSLQAGGANASVDLSNQAIAQQGDVVIDSAVSLQGPLVITAGLGAAAGNGAITITGGINGNANGQSGGAPDSITLHADGAVHVIGAIGGTQPLANFSIDGATDVAFDKAVHLSGDMIIHATGTVEFKDLLTLDGGSLTIIGASRVVLAGVVIAEGDLVIDGAASLSLLSATLGRGNVHLHVDALSLGGPLSAAGGALTIAPTASSHSITIGDTGDGLLLSASTLGNLRGFASVQFSTAANVAIDTAALANLSTGELTITGAAIRVQGAANAPSLQVSGHITLTANGDVELSGRFGLAAAGADLIVDSRGSLVMASGALIQTNGGDVTLQADRGIALGRVDTRNNAGNNAGIGSAGGVMLLTQGATASITDVDKDEGINVYASWLSVRGRGPALLAGMSTTAAAIDVSVDRIDLDNAGGLILRDTGADGRTRFNLLDNGVLYQQLVAEGGPLRGSTAPIASTSTDMGNSATDAAARMAAWLSAVSPLAELRNANALTGAARMAMAAALPADSAAAHYLATLGDGLEGTAGLSLAGPHTVGAESALQMSAIDLLSDASFGMAERLESAWLLGGNSGPQPASSGLLKQAADSHFDAWEESLVL